MNGYHSAPVQIHFDHPAQRWREAAPLGNGRMGIMAYGDPLSETFELTEVTCFSGNPSPEENSQPHAQETFQQMRKALLQGDYDTAAALGKLHMGKRQNYGTNLPLGELSVTCPRSSEPENYSHTLDLLYAVDTLAYTCGGTAYTRTAFLSHPHDLAALRWTASQPASCNLNFSLKGSVPHRITVLPDNSLLLSGQALETKHSDGTSGTCFGIQLVVRCQGGELTASSQGIQVCGADSVEAFLLLATDFPLLGSKNLRDWRAALEKQAAFLPSLSWESIETAHRQDFSSHFSTSLLSIGKADAGAKTIQQLLQEVRETGNHSYLSALLYQYGRYLLLSSSRKDSPLPAHLQGVWNDHIACNIGWTCDMHLDVNTQMNYWPADLTGLEECLPPLFAWLEKCCVPSGRISAEKNYGFRGWCAEVVSNAWGFSAPFWSPNLEPSPGCGIWLLSHLWEHFRFTQDLDFLRERAFPLMEESVLFFLDFLFEDPRTGGLSCGPAISPENLFVKDGKACAVSLNPTFEVLMIRELFTAYLEAAELLGQRGELVSQVQDRVNRLPAYQIGSDGELKEWEHDYPSSDPQHRHQSHLLGLFPFAQITPEETPELAKAAQKSIALKLTPRENWEDTGWARSMLMLYAARLHQPQTVGQHIWDMITQLAYPNLMIQHPPTRGTATENAVYELDGNTGLVTCIAESLLQSHRGRIRLLPALPPQWETGSVTGLRTRGGLTVDLHWEEGQLQEAVLLSPVDQDVTLCLGLSQKAFSLKGGLPFSVTANML